MLCNTFTSNKVWRVKLPRGRDWLCEGGILDMEMCVAQQWFISILCLEFIYKLAIEVDCQELPWLP